MTTGDPIPETETTVAHIGGGRSAVAAAIAIAVVLGAVVWLGASGRPPAPPVPVAQASPIAEPPRVLTDASPTPAASAATAASTPDDSFAISLRIGRQEYIRYLDELEPGHLSGQVRIDLPPEEWSEAANLSFHQLSAPWAAGQMFRIGNWPMTLEPLATDSKRVSLVVNTSVPADPRSGNVPRPTREGFWIRAGIRTATTDAATIEVDIRIGPDQRLLGRTDGLFGPEGNAPDAPAVAGPARVDYPRDRGLYNRCRWDISPYSGKPIPGTDEADC